MAASQARKFCPRLYSTFSLAAVAWIFHSSVAVAQPESKDAAAVATVVQGQVTVAGTDDVVPLTKLMFAGSTDPTAQHNQYRAETGADGTYRLEYSAPAYAVLCVTLPPGYLFPSETRSNNSAFTVDMSSGLKTATKDFSVIRGPIWRLQLTNLPESLDLSKLTCAIVSDRAEVSFARINAAGVVEFTPPAESGEFRLQLQHPALPIELAEDVSLLLPEGFDPAQITQLETGSGIPTKLIDEQSRTATLRGVTGIRTGAQQTQFSVALKPLGSVRTASFKTTILDENGNPFANERTGILLLSGESSRTIKQRFQTGQDGQLEIEDITLCPESADQGDLRLRITSTTGAYGIAAFQLADDSQAVIDLGTVTLKQGRIATLTVVNSLGNPQPGATVSSYSGIAGPAMNVTDKNGNCQLHIQSGEQTISGVFGRLFGFIAVPANEEDVRVELVLSRSLDDTGTGFETAGRGMPAPQLSVAEWTDGQRRQLADFKGKVVVLYFWNKDEEHCDEQIASIDRLQQRYAGQPVVFLGVHKAGVKAADVREYMLTQDWHLPTGVDVSSDEVDGSTFLAYETAPSYIAVIGKDGRLSFNFSAIASEEVGEAIFARAATELGYKWPIEESPGADEKAGCEPCTQIFERIESQAIDAALEQ